MALIPYSYRPRVIIKRNALRQGIFGPSLFWKVVAVGVFGGGQIRRFFGKSPEPIATRTLATGAVLHLLTAKPMSRKERKRSGVNKQILREQAIRDTNEAMELFHPS